MNLIELGIAFRVKDGVSYHEYNNEFYAIGQTPKFCFVDSDLTKLENKVKNVLEFMQLKSKANRE